MAGGGAPVGEATFFGAFVVVCNLIMGTGLLALPKAFYNAGYILGPITLVVFAFCAYTSLAWLFEAQVHAFMLDRLFARNFVRLEGGEKDSESGSLVETLSLLEAVKQNSSATIVANNTIQSDDISRAFDFENLDRSWYMQITDTMRILCGPKWANGFMVCQIVNMFFVMWAYTCILAGTAVMGIPLGFTERLWCDTSDQKKFDSHPECYQATRIFLGIYWLTNSLLLLRDWSFINYAQKAVTVIANLSIVTMVITAAVAITQRAYPDPGLHAKANHTTLAPSTSWETLTTMWNTTTTAIQTTVVSTTTTSAPIHTGSYAQNVPAFNFAKFGNLFGVAVFCLLCHPAATYAWQNMPSKEQTKKILLLAFVVLTLLYTLVAEVVSWYMGDMTEAPVTLNWSNYNVWGVKNVFGDVLGGILLFYPLFTVNAAFVMYVRSLSDVIIAALPARLRCRLVVLLLRRETKDDDELASGNWRLVVAMRMTLIAACTVLSLGTWNFGVALTFVGFSGFFLMFHFPAVAQIYGTRKLQEISSSLQTEIRSPFSDALSGIVPCIALLILGSACAVYYVIVAIVPIFEGKSS